MQLPEYSDIAKARLRIEKFIHRTPVLTSTQLNIITGAELYFKCENFQKMGAFKMRGASNAVFNLSDEQAEKGVATHSSGNFAQALALAAKIRNIPATIVMPENSPKAKINAVAGYGGNIILCEPTLKARESTLNKFIEKSGAIFLHPYDNFDVIAGQGTAAAEFLEDIQELNCIVAPVGGGGLISGTAISAKYFNPELQVIAAEPIEADDAFRSLKAGYIIPSENPKTIADGLLTSLGKLNFPIIQKLVDDILTVSETGITNAMYLIWERMKIIIEPSAAVPLAAIIENKDIFHSKKVGIILSGGNLDLAKLPWLS